MKSSIHPQYFEDALITCNCGHTFKVGSTKAELTVEICSHCHPFFTGDTSHFADTEGKVKKFQKKQERAKTFTAKKKADKKTQTPQEDTGPKTLKEMLMGLK